MRVVRAQARFENLPALADHFETPACRFAVAIVSSQVAKRLFALKDGGRSRLLSLHIGTRRRQHDTGTSVRSPPSRMRKILAPAPKGTRALSAGHVAPFHHGVFLLAHPFRELACPVCNNDLGAWPFEFLYFFALLQLREMIRRNVIVPLPGNSWEGKLIARRKLRCSICGCWAGPACEERELLFL